ncbi:MAG TPA: hypothetical protein VHC40_01075 [Rhizomicrobium sp.]|jgi:hypothetical protein|nr:hypothetical protein [Rhizomicrobium sp.]
MKYLALAAALVAFSAPAFACGDKSASNDTRQKMADNSTIQSGGQHGSGQSVQHPRR